MEGFRQTARKSSLPNRKKVMTSTQMSNEKGNGQSALTKPYLTSDWRSAKEHAPSLQKKKKSNFALTKMETSSHLIVPSTGGHMGQAEVRVWAGSSAGKDLGCSPSPDLEISLLESLGNMLHVGQTLGWILLTPLLVRALKWKVSTEASKDKKMEE